MKCVKKFKRKLIVYDTNTNTNLKMFMDTKWNNQLQLEVQVDALCTTDDSGK